ncbi:hypothetical protein L7F22_067170 [Adiantum nelumboides]|nr:hypothetical protein [Adiantum nelumboides]
MGSLRTLACRLCCHYRASALCSSCTVRLTVLASLPPSPASSALSAIEASSHRAPKFSVRSLFTIKDPSRSFSQLSLPSVGTSGPISDGADKLLLVDTLALVRKLEAQGFDAKQAKAITAAMTDVLNDCLQNVSDSFVSQSELEQYNMKLGSACTKLQTDLQSAQALMVERQQVGKTPCRASRSNDFVAFGHDTVNDDKEKTHVDEQPLVFVGHRQLATHGLVNGQESDEQVMRQTILMPTSNAGCFGGGSVFQAMIRPSPGLHGYMYDNAYGEMQSSTSNPMYGNIGVQPGFQCAAGGYGMPGVNMEKRLSAIHRETEKLRVDIEKLHSEIRFEMDKVTAGQRLDLNLERGRIKEELASQSAETSNLTNKLDKDFNALKLQLEASKYDVIKYCIGTIASVYALGLGLLRVFK